MVKKASPPAGNRLERWKIQVFRRPESALRFPCSSFAWVLARGRDPVGKRDGEQGSQEENMDADQPAELRIVVVLDVHERFQHLNCGYRDNRGRQLLLQAPEIDLGHPVRTIVIAGLRSEE